LSDRALLLVVNRLTAPGSEHGLARFLETDFVCDRHGRRWLAAWRDDGERLASRTPRVRVELRQLKQWYRTLDQLLEHKAEIEHALFITLRDLFSLKVDMVFYDLTSTYFEGQGPPGTGACGHSRDDKPRNPQVLVGLVVVDGWPIAHHVFAGNRRDANTVPDVLRDLEQRFGLKRVVFVGDRGMVTSQNLDDLRAHGHGYIVGRNRRRSGEVFDYIQSATGPWIECPVGITARGEGVIAQDAGSGGLIQPTGCTRVCRPVRRTRGVRAQAPHQSHGAGARQARKARTPHCRGTPQGRRKGRCRSGARALPQSWPPLLWLVL
jgi:hypothetical protein